MKSILPPTQFASLQSSCNLPANVTGISSKNMSWSHMSISKIDCPPFQRHHDWNVPDYIRKLKYYLMGGFNWGKFDPITVWQINDPTNQQWHGKSITSDGTHRVEMMLLINECDVPVDVRHGTYADAFNHYLSSNDTNAIKPCNRFYSQYSLGNPKAVSLWNIVKQSCFQILGHSPSNGLKGMNITPIQHCVNISQSRFLWVSTLLHHYFQNNVCSGEMLVGLVMFFEYWVGLGRKDLDDPTNVDTFFQWLVGISSSLKGHEAFIQNKVTNKQAESVLDYFTTKYMDWLVVVGNKKRFDTKFGRMDTSNLKSYLVSKKGLANQTTLLIIPPDWKTTYWNK